MVLEANVVNTLDCQTQIYPRRTWDKRATIHMPMIYTYTILFRSQARCGDDSLEKLIISNVERHEADAPSRWADQIKENKTSKLHIMVRIAADRDHWTQFVRSRDTT